MGRKSENRRETCPCKDNRYNSLDSIITIIVIIIIIPKAPRISFSDTFNGFPYLGGLRKQSVDNFYWL